MKSKFKSSLLLNIFPRYYVESGALIFTGIFFFSISFNIHAEPEADGDLQSGEGMINRAPFVSTKITPSNLDRITNDIGNITESLSNILTDETNDEEVITENEQLEEADQPVIAIPEAVIPKEIELAKPVVTKSEPVLAKQKPSDTQVILPAEPVVIIPEINTEAIAAATPQINENTIKIKYLKKSNTGDVLPDNATEWACVEDVENGLIWEVKSDTGVQNTSNSYSWFEPDAIEEPQGVADGGRCSGDADCDTHAYVTLLNERNYCGYSNWRLPTKDEMLSIVNFDSNAPVKINTDYFPDALPSWYWTASSNENHPDHAWYVLFRNGIALNDLKERPKHIRLVRTQTDKS
ncbi:MAG: DUF1566 domain-containing protein [Gammaproteobacteria bacterium]|nr:DUF1566 domain-containing protein [Gammaproteobacteria bacterium]